MAGEGGGGTGGGGGDGGGGDGGAGPDAGDIFKYLNYQNWFSKDGDYTGNAGYYGDNIGPTGSEKPVAPDARADATRRDLMESPLRLPPLLQRPGPGTHNAPAGSADRPSAATALLQSLAGSPMDVYSGLADETGPTDPFRSWPATPDPRGRTAPWSSLRSELAPGSAVRPASLLRSPHLLADNAGVVPQARPAAALPETRRDAPAVPGSALPDGRGVPPRPPSPDWQADLQRLAAAQKDAPVLAYLNGEWRTLPSYTTKELIIRPHEEDGPVHPVPPQQPPPPPDHRFGLYVFRQAAEQALDQTTRDFKAGRYLEALVGAGVHAFAGSVAQLENLMPYNAPDHFLAAGQYAQRWIWFDMRGHAGQGLIELAKGQDEAGAALSGAELAAGAMKSLAPSSLRLEAPVVAQDRGTKYFVENKILRAQDNTNNAYSYDTVTNARVVAMTLRDIELQNPGAAVYVGSGGHGEALGSSFVTDPRLREPRFYAQDQVTVKSLQDIGIGRVLDLNNPADAQIFKNAEQMARQPGQDFVFTVRAWCFSTRSCF